MPRSSDRRKSGDSNGDSLECLPIPNCLVHMQLVLRDLSKTYPNGTHALKDVSLDVLQGMFGLLGRNGAGKSTLMRIITTLQEPDTGTITLAGPAGTPIDVVRQKDRVRETLGYPPQSFGLTRGCGTPSGRRRPARAGPPRPAPWWPGLPEGARG
jgi:ABC-type bacteriocin/lantibiotic exporter with double-glycine peptidase domain